MKARELWFVGAALAGCVDPEPGAWVEREDRPRQPVAEQVIDAGSAVELEPGAGVGVAIEYLGAGSWRLTTSCDTRLTEAPCDFDIVVSVDPGDGELSQIGRVDLEPGDELELLDPFVLQLLLRTELDLDTAEFSAPPGVSLRVFALLYDPIVGSRFDWANDPRLLSWVGHGAVNWGAPTNPIDLTPDQP